MNFLSATHAKCTPSYFFGCNDDEKLTIQKYDDHLYSEKECYDLCSNTFSCAGFNFGPYQYCILKEEGCTYYGKPEDGSYYAMTNCQRCTIYDNINICLQYVLKKLFVYKMNLTSNFHF